MTLFTQSSQLLRRAFIQSLGIDDSKDHLPELTYLKILDWYSVGLKKKDYIHTAMEAYRKTKEKFPKVEDWENAQGTDKIIKYGSKSNSDYYYAMIFCRRIKADWAILNSYFAMPTMLQQFEKDKFKVVFDEFQLKKTARQNVLQFVQKIMIITDKDLSQIDEKDIHYFREYVTRPEFARSTFHVLLRLGNIRSDSEYIFAGNIAQKTAFLLNQNTQFASAYEEYSTDIDKRFPPRTLEKKIGGCRKFLNWLWEYKPRIVECSELTFEILKEYATFLKESLIPKQKKPYSKLEIVAKLSQLKTFFEFLVKKDLVNHDFTQSLGNINSLYPRGYKGRVFPFPVPIQDRKAIEEIVYKGYPANYMAELLLKLIYLMALRPFEALSLRLDCIRGTKNTPTLHVHKGKGYKERFIPMPEEVYSLVKELQEYNKNSSPIYSSYDEILSQRLFTYRGTIILESSLNVIFGNLQVNNDLKNFKGEAKYSLYILRKIRITMWLENSLSEDEVAYLAGHGDVDSHNYYLVGKETRIVNAQKVYNAYYSDFFEQIKNTGIYIPPAEPEILRDSEYYLKGLKLKLIQIENKNINQVSLEELIKNMPASLFPVPCGKCFAMAIEEGFECERLKFPCLECAELINAENHMDEFDNYVNRLFEQRQLQAKGGLDGLVERTDALLCRLNDFYIRKFQMTKEQVNNRFEVYKEKHITKRGRKKRITNTGGN